MAECRLATDVFPFCGVDLRIVRRDISGDGGDADDASTGAASNQSADDDDWVDPNFFDEGYSVAATTGFCRVWEGAEVLTRLLEEGCDGDDDSDASTPSLRSRVAGKRVLELGSGVGLCGIAAASAGAHVMCTDLEAVVEGVLYRNIGENTSTDDDEVQAASSSRPWSAGERIKGGNGGTCVAQVLDWTKSIDDAVVGARTAVSEEARAVEGGHQRREMAVHRRRHRRGRRRRRRRIVRERPAGLRARHGGGVPLVTRTRRPLLRHGDVADAFGAGTKRDRAAVRAVVQGPVVQEWRGSR